ncbi:MAG: GNAT family N-acetyltransferase [Chloroflexi bacterium]|nr:GNAT family N-acetyltransferase [Chloroflexota bacterium]
MMETIAFDTTLDPDAARVVRAGLAAYNRSRVGDGEYRELTIFLRDPDRAVVGGLLGDTYWGWLSINIVWVAESLRGQGYGRALLAMAEREALQRGCHHAHLDTMSFQARPFYEREGYRVFGALHDVPMGHSRYFMQKALG